MKYEQKWAYQSFIYERMFSRKEDAEADDWTAVGTELHEAAGKTAAAWSQTAHNLDIGSPLGRAIVWLGREIVERPLVEPVSAEQAITVTKSCPICCHRAPDPDRVCGFKDCPTPGQPHL